MGNLIVYLESDDNMLVQKLIGELLNNTWMSSKLLPLWDEANHL